MNHRDSVLGPTGCGGSSCAQGLVDYGLNKSQFYGYFSSTFTSWTNFSSLGIGLSSVSSLNHQLSLQLNLVANDVEEGSSYGSYWLQNAAVIKQISPGNFQIGVLNNVWNFSSKNAIMKGALLGNQDQKCKLPMETTPIYICQTSLAIKVKTPFEIQLTSYATMCNSGSGLAFWIAIYQNNLLKVKEFYDGLCFQSNDHSFPPFFLVGGTNPTGLYSDAELVLGGAGSGAIVTLTALKMKMSLDYLNSQGVFVSIPHGWSSAGDTGEGLKKAKMSASGNIGIGNLGTDNSVELF